MSEFHPWERPEDEHDRHAAESVCETCGGTGLVIVYGSSGEHGDKCQQPCEDCETWWNKNDPLNDADREKFL